jgi:hypothetical protein
MEDQDSGGLGDNRKDVLQEGMNSREGGMMRGTGDSKVVLVTATVSHLEVGHWDRQGTGHGGDRGEYGVRPGMENRGQDGKGLGASKGDRKGREERVDGHGREWEQVNGERESVNPGSGRRGRRIHRGGGENGCGWLSCTIMEVK